MRIAINQPYFIPYSGYFRLFDVDLFVFLDDAQYVDRSYINRNILTKNDGSVDWFSIPLKNKPQETKINELEFSLSAADDWKKKLRRFKVFGEGQTLFGYVVAETPRFRTPLYAIGAALDRAREELKISCPTTYSSKITSSLLPGLKGQDRILAICEHFKATEYVNAPGGKKLYDPVAFRERGIGLKFLKPYGGEKISILERLTFEKAADVRKEIDENVEFDS